MHTGGFVGWTINLFSTPIGVVVLAALDSTLFFSLPFGIDAAVIISAARARAFAWAIPGLASFGATAGAALTFWMGVKIGEKGLERHVPKKRLARVRNMLRTRGAVTIAALDLIPPPFPFTPFMLAAGALEVDKTALFSTLLACRLLRFGIETYLARKYGTSILQALDSEAFKRIVTVCIVLAVLGSIFSVVKLIQASKGPPPRSVAA